MYKTLRKDIPLVKPEAYGYQHPKYHHNTINEIIQGDGPFHHHQLI